MKDKYLIINADDCGLSDGIDRAIEKCFRSGRITGASLSPAGENFSAAVDMLKSVGKRSVGVHLTLTGNLEPSCRDAGSVASLVGKDKKFFKGHAEIVKRYALGLIARDHVYNEFKSQIEKIIGAGLAVDHIDSHEHIHMLPDIFKTTLSLAKEFNIPYVRITGEKKKFTAGSFFTGDIFRYAGMSFFRDKAKKEAARQGVKFNDASIGFVHFGKLNDELLCSLLDKVPHGVTELIVHPGGGVGSDLEMVLEGFWKKHAENLGIKAISHCEI